MTLTTLTINTINYTSYATVAEADAFLAVDPIRKATWEALPDVDAKGRELVAATRRLDLLSWAGSKDGGDDTQESAWPRSGLTFLDGSTVPNIGVPKEVENSVILLAGTINIEAEVSQAGSSGSNIKKVEAGSVEVAFFRQTDGVPLQDESAFNLISLWLQANAISEDLGASAFNNTGTSVFEDADSFGLNKGFP